MTFSDCLDSIEEFLACDDMTDERKTIFTRKLVGLEKALVVWCSRQH